MSDAILDEVGYLRENGEAAVAELFTGYTAQLSKMVSFRLDQRLIGRIDTADVIQDAYLEVSKRIGEYTSNPQVSFFVWARQLTWQVVLKTNRKHLQTKKRDANRELPLDRKVKNGGDTSVALAAHLVANMKSPSGLAMESEMFGRLHDALETMDSFDREVLALRHFEQLGNKEVAEILGLKSAAASNRYIRALKRLKEILDKVHGSE